MDEVRTRAACHIEAEKVMMQKRHEERRETQFRYVTQRGRPSYIVGTGEQQGGITQRFCPESYKRVTLVLRRAQPHTSTGKLRHNWKGPFRIREIVGGGAYLLEELNGRVIPRTRNSTSLKIYFS